jgi:ATP-dependent RNA helicase RhlE
MKFTDYRLPRAIEYNLEDLGFKRPTDIQFKSIKPILAGEDVLAIAQTGTGKTAAFVIPVLSILMDNPRKNEGIRCIVLVPTRELALQISDVFEKIGNDTGIKTLCVVGGVEQNPQIAQLEKGIDVIIATPGRMFDLIYQKHIRITHTEILVLDEADLMLDLGFVKDIQDVKKFLPKHHQTLFFSATINEEIKKVAYSLVRNAIRIQIAPNERVSRNITHSVAFIEMDDKRFFLERLIAENPENKIIVFVRTKVRAERVAAAMERVGIKTETLHGDKEQAERQQVLDNFRAGTNQTLIATDLSARGIDIAHVDYVVNYDLPDVPENYVHRVGRTGRGVLKGKAISFCSAEEKPILKEIEGFLSKPIRVLEVDKKDYNATVDFSQDTSNYDLKALMKEVAEFEDFKKKKKKKKK